MPLYQGPHQIGNCQRCGWKLQRRALTEDGRLRNLLVCAACWDPDHPQDYPAPPRPEGLPPWRPSLVGAVWVAPVLTLDAEDETTADLSWTEADSGDEIVTQYQLFYRLAGSSVWIADEIFLVERDEFAAITAQTLDTVFTYPAPGIYEFYVVASDAGGSSAGSNTVVTSGVWIVAPVLGAEQDAAGDPVEVSWTAATSSESIVGYRLYVSVNGDTYTLIDDLGPAVLDYEDATDYDDGDELSYYVQAHTATLTADSNEASLTYEAAVIPVTNSILMHFDETPLIDSSGNDYDVHNATVTYSTSRSKFGSGSGQGARSANNIKVPGSQGFFDNTSWSIDAWVWVDDGTWVATPLLLIGNTAFLAFPILGFGVGVIGGDPGFEAVVLKAGWHDGAPHQLTAGHNFPTDQWVHVAMCYDSVAEVTRLFENGVMVDSYSGPTSFNGSFETMSVYNIGAGSGSGASGGGKNCYVDEWHATQTAAFTANFTPPVAPYPDGP